MIGHESFMLVFKRLVFRRTSLPKLLGQQIDSTGGVSRASVACSQAYKRYGDYSDYGLNYPKLDPGNQIQPTSLERILSRLSSR